MSVLDTIVVFCIGAFVGIATKELIVMIVTYRKFKKQLLEWDRERRSVMRVLEEQRRRLIESENRAD